MIAARRYLPLWMLAALLVAPNAAAGQHITLKTLPIPAGEQFELLPSRNLGMGGLRVALDDALADPFINPARGTLVDRLHLMALPTFYGEASGQVGGRSLPMAVTVPGRRVFGSFAFALQQVARPQRAVFFGPWPGIIPDFERVIIDNSSSNIYVLGSVGTRFNDGRTAVGVSAYHADLEAVDAVNLLYARSISIQQGGSLSEFRAGLTHDLQQDRRLDAVIARASLDMQHDVWYMDWTWQANAPPITRTWQELNEDRTVTWSGSVRYSQPLGGEGARIAAMIAGSTKAHPKIPNYDVVNIPRDPGNSAAGNFGIGLSNRSGPAIFGAELTFEPGRSHTWAFADTVIATPTGALQPGDKTVDNQFRFRNWNMGFGVDRQGEMLGFQLGMRLRQIRYSLDQQNFLTERRRQTRESWMEWSPAWGAALKFDEFELRYSGRFTARGWPDVMPFFFAGRDVMLAAPGNVDFVVAPTEPVNMPDFRVTLHRIMISVPFSF
jgi:hypothetical protein